MLYLAGAQFYQHAPAFVQICSPPGFLLGHSSKGTDLSISNIAAVAPPRQASIAPASSTACSNTYRNADGTRMFSSNANNFGSDNDGMSRGNFAKAAAATGLAALLADTPSVADSGPTRTVVVTGANSGLGLDAATKLVRFHMWYDTTVEIAGYSIPSGNRSVSFRGN